MLYFTYNAVGVPSNLEPRTHAAVPQYASSNSIHQRAFTSLALTGVTRGPDSAYSCGTFETKIQIGTVTEVHSGGLESEGGEAALA